MTNTGGVRGGGGGGRGETINPNYFLSVALHYTQAYEALVTKGLVNTRLSVKLVSTGRVIKVDDRACFGAKRGGGRVGLLGWT